MTVTIIGAIGVPRNTFADPQCKSLGMHDFLESTSPALEATLRQTHRAESDEFHANQVDTNLYVDHNSQTMSRLGNFCGE